MSIAAGGGVDVEGLDDIPGPAIPYNRSGTQIFEDPRNRNRGGEEGEEEEEEDIVITDEVLEKMWDQYERDPDFFKEIEIAKDGGFSEVDELIGGMRYISAAMAVGFVLLNVGTIFYINGSLILSAGLDNNSTQIFLVTKQFALEPLAAGPLPQIQAFITNDKAIYATLELLMITVYVLRMGCNAWAIACPSNEMARWVGVQELFWNSLPEAATISCVKLLNYVTPAVLLPALTQSIAFGPDSTCIGVFFNFLQFLIIRIITGIVGFDAFLFRLQITTDSMAQAQEEALADDGQLGAMEVFWLMTTALAFLNQMLGIVQLGWFVRKRIFAFIFAGEDGQLSPEEDALKEVWESMLAQRIWMDLPPKQAIVAYLSYSDFDFQKLALETVKPGHQKKEKAPSDRRAAREAAATGARGSGAVELVSAS